MDLMQKTHSLPFIGLAVLALLLGRFSSPNNQDDSFAGQVILEGMVHLGDNNTPEWPEAAAEPDGLGEYVFKFKDAIGGSERALAFTTRDAHSKWVVKINNKYVCTLKHTGEPSEFVVPVPKDIVRKGANTFSLSTEKAGDDLTFGRVTLSDKPYREVFNLRTVNIKCADADGAALACRVSIVSANGDLAKTHFADESPYPTRDGVVYTDLSGVAEVLVEAGDYIVTASHGPEFSIDQHSLAADDQQPFDLSFKLVHEVDTRGWLSADTHLHTYTHSGHGDASTDERIITLAGDHTEIAISTDHNKQIDYLPTMKKHGVKNEYTHIVGNEVTTDLGHFNSFPLPAGGAIPDASITDWSMLNKEIRDKGAEVIILNHPRWPSFVKGPFGVQELNQETGLFTSGIDLAVDVIELINSDDPGSPFDVSIKDWFALLNAGNHVMAAGSSDSHAVFVPTGLGRTWVKSKTDDPSKAAEKSIAANIRDGHSSAALGLFGEVHLNGMGSGEDVKQSREGLNLSCRIAHASWADVYRIDIYVNGEVEHQIDVPEHSGTAFDQTFEYTLNDVKEDSWVVCVAYGKRPGSWWATKFPELYFASNPIFIKK